MRLRQRFSRGPTHTWSRRAMQCNTKSWCTSKSREMVASSPNRVTSPRARTVDVVARVANDSSILSLPPVLCATSTCGSIFDTASAGRTRRRLSLALRPSPAAHLDVFRNHRIAQRGWLLPSFGQTVAALAPSRWRLETAWNRPARDTEACC